MAQGSKKKYTSKQKRMAKHIEDGESKKHGSKAAARIAWATVNKETGGAGKSVKRTASSKKGGRKGGKAAAQTKRATKSRSSSSHAWA